MTTYSPQPAEPGGSRPACANCGAAFRLHRAPEGTLPALPGRQLVTSQGLDKLLAAGVQLVCPEAYRPSSLVAALGALATAQQRGDANGIFAARGEVQRLMGHRPQGDGHCTCCTALADTAR